MIAEQQSAKREWIDLTEDDRDAIWDRAEKRMTYQGVNILLALIQETEKKVKEKNNG